MYSRVVKPSLVSVAEGSAWNDTSVTSANEMWTCNEIYWLTFLIAPLLEMIIWWWGGRCGWWGVVDKQVFSSVFLPFPPGRVVSTEVYKRQSKVKTLFVCFVFLKWISVSFIESPAAINNTLEWRNQFDLHCDKSMNVFIFFTVSLCNYIISCFHFVMDTSLNVPCLPLKVTVLSDNRECMCG